MQKLIDHFIKEGGGAFAAQIVLPFAGPMSGSVSPTDQKGVYQMMVATEKGPMASYFSGDQVVHLIPVPNEILPKIPDLGSKSDLVLDGN